MDQRQRERSLAKKASAIDRAIPIIPAPLCLMIAAYIPYPQTKGQIRRVCRDSWHTLKKNLLRSKVHHYRIFNFHRFVRDLIQNSPNIFLSARDEEVGGAEIISWLWERLEGNHSYRYTFGYHEAGLSDLMLIVNENYCVRTPSTTADVAHFLNQLFEDRVTNRLLYNAKTVSLSDLSEEK